MAKTNLYIIYLLRYCALVVSLHVAFSAVALAQGIVANEATSEERNRRTVTEAFDGWQAGKAGFFETLLSPTLSGLLKVLAQAQELILDEPSR